MPSHLLTSRIILGHMEHDESIPAHIMRLMFPMRSNPSIVNTWLWMSSIFWRLYESLETREIASQVQLVSIHLNSTLNEFFDPRWSCIPSKSQIYSAVINQSLFIKTTPAWQKHFARVRNMFGVFTCCHWYNVMCNNTPVSAFAEDLPVVELLIFRHSRLLVTSSRQFQASFLLYWCDARKLLIDTIQESWMIDNAKKNPWSNSVACLIRLVWGLCSILDMMGLLKPNFLLCGILWR